MIDRMIRKGKGEAGQLSLMIIISMLTQVIALYKSTVTATNFGASLEMDAYHFANNITTFLFAFVASGVTTVVIPAYVQKRRTKAINSFITLIYAVVFLGTGLLFLFRKPVFTMLSGRGEEFVTLSCDLMPFTVIIQSVTAVLAITTAFYQCNNRYNIPKIIVFCCNLLTVVLLMCTRALSIYDYLWILTLSAVVNLVIDMVIALKIGFRYTPATEFSSSDCMMLIRTFIPCMFSTGVYKVHSLVDSLIATSLGDGQLTILSYANMIVSLVNTLIVSNLTVYAYPRLVAKMHVQEERQAQKSLWEYSILFQWVVCLLISGYIAVGREGINLLFLRGKFDAEAANMVFLCCGLYLFGQQNNIVRDLVYRYFFAKADTKTTFKNSVMISILNLGLSILLVQIIGIFGIIIGTVLAGIISLVMILLKMRKKFGLYDEFKTWMIEFCKNNLIMFSTVAAILLVKSKLATGIAIVDILIFGILTVAVFAGCTILAKSKALKVKL